MKKIVLGLIAATFLPLTAQAELIIGAKAGLFHLNPDDAGIDSLPAAMVSGQLGYEFMDLIAADLAFELEVGKTVTDVELDIPGEGKTDRGLLTGGAFISARSAGPIYAIGRVGYSRQQADTEGLESNSYTDGSAIGVGVGFSTGVRGELELTRYDIEENEAYYLSFGIAF